MDKLPAARGRLDVRELLAFGAIYFLWGATFLAIRIAVLEIPPFFTAGLRFFVAGSFLYGVLRLRGEPAPSAAQWRGIAIIASAMFVVTYGALFWATQFVPSSVVALLEATLPIIAMVLEVFVFRRQPFRWPMLGAVALGFAGIALLLWKNGSSGQPVPTGDSLASRSVGGPIGQSFGVFPCVVILCASVAWTLGAVLTRSMALPRSVPLTAGAEMMLGGAVLLAISLLAGELHPFPHISLHAGLAVLYLIVGGSLVAFTSYVWLLARMPATRVASHAYVNPVVAVALGHFVAGEEVTSRMLFASVLVVAGVFLILKPPSVTEPAN
jgi:drug/metabolite transporter (DMT)-like permease